MNNWICCLFIAFLFFLLTPGIVVSIPPRGSKYAVALTHAIVFAIIRSAVFFLFCLLTSKNLHNNMLDSVIKSKMRFFDLNPIGRIMNRFTKDMSSIDEVLPNKIFDFFQVTLFDSIRCS